ncbi:MAG: DUF5680 domain-containing protein [Oscillospiraceae bacterium]
MDFSEKLAVCRKRRGWSQEQLSDEMVLSRQSVAKWESGQSVPELVHLIRLAELFGVSVDYLVRDGESCLQAPLPRTVGEDALRGFLMTAKRKTYAGKGAECASSRPASHDLRYAEGAFLYIDSYLGGERFSGEEAVWEHGEPVFAMNYSGRVTGAAFSGDFLKAALCEVPYDAPYRGPAHYAAGDALYLCRWEGTLAWFQGYEEILFKGERIYECFFHGGAVK